MAHRSAALGQDVLIRPSFPVVPLGQLVHSISWKLTTALICNYPDVPTSTIAAIRLQSPERGQVGSGWTCWPKDWEGYIELVLMLRNRFVHCPQLLCSPREQNGDETSWKSIKISWIFRDAVYNESCNRLSWIVLWWSYLAHQGLRLKSTAWPDNCCFWVLFYKEPTKNFISLKWNSWLALVRSAAVFS